VAADDVTPGSEDDARPRAAVVFNPAKQEHDALEAALGVAERVAGYGPSLMLPTTEEDPGAAMTAEAVASGADVVVAAGGDGTVRTVVAGLRGTGIPLGLLPAGTGNLLARNLGLPLSDVPAALRVALAGAERRVDVGLVEMVRADGTREEQCFAVMAGIGLDAEMIAETDEELKKRAGWLAYGRAVWVAMRGGSRIPVRYRLADARARTLRVHTLLVGNCGLLPADVVLLPDAVVDDGLLDVVCLRPDGLLGWLRIAGHVIVVNKLLRRLPPERAMRASPGHDTERDAHPLRYLQTRTITVQLRRPEPFELDGDLAGEVRGFTCRVDPGGLLVRTPSP